MSFSTLHIYKYVIILIPSSSEMYLIHIIILVVLDLSMRPDRRVGKPEPNEGCDPKPVIIFTAIVVNPVYK